MGAGRLLDASSPRPGAARLAVLVSLLAVAGCRPAAEPAAGSEALSVVELLGGAEASGFARALEPRLFRFPADHGAHPEFRTEWWYFTGNLAGPGGRRFGYQLTFFRSALTARPEPRASRWAADQVYMAHFAVVDVEAARFASFERFARGAAGLAGADAGPFRVWLEDWSATGGGELPPIRLSAADGGTALDLELAPGKPLVLQGERGLSRKGREPGNASYYYSLTRMPTTGSLTSGGETFTVTGASWMDREWSTSSLDAGVVGWDWFSLQLDDGRDLMVYRLRRADGTSDPRSAGSLVGAAGGVSPLGAQEFEIEPDGLWRSPRTGREYPSGWLLSVPSEGLELTVSPLLADQEIDHSVVYWEGAVRAAGTAGGRPVGGWGYVELTGYGARSP